MAENLTGETELFLRLVDDTDWRERVVEEFIFGSGEHARVVSTFQLAVAPEVIAEVTDTEPYSARALLPLTTRDKRPLLNFAVAGPDDSEALLVPRAFTASLQATYLSELLDVAEAPEPFGPPTRDLIEAICVFTPTLFMHFVAEAGDWHRGIAAYLTSGLDLAEPITPEQAEDWSTACAAAAEPLIARLNEPREMSSSAETVLLALPGLAEPPTDSREIDDVVEAYHAGLRALDRLGADDFLRMLAEYGRRWQMVLELDIPVGQRFKVRVAEDRPLNPKGRVTSRQRFALGDAASGHLEVRVVDHSVCLGERPVVRNLHGAELQAGLLEAERFTPEAASVYSSEPARPPLVEVDVILRLRGGALAPPLVFALIALFATVTVLLLPSDGQLATKLGVLAIPITVTAAVLIVREQSALAQRLHTWPRRLLVSVTVFLWIAVLARLIVDGADLPPW